MFGNTPRTVSLLLGGLILLVANANDLEAQQDRIDATQQANAKAAVPVYTFLFVPPPQDVQRYRLDATRQAHAKAAAPVYTLLFCPLFIPDFTHGYPMDATRQRNVPSGTFLYVPQHSKRAGASAAGLGRRAGHGSAQRDE